MKNRTSNRIKGDSDEKAIIIRPFGPTMDNKGVEFDKAQIPIKAISRRDWFETDGRTTNLAKFCLPLTMANSAGYYLVSPVHFKVTWDGYDQSPAHIEIIEILDHAVIDDHSTFGGFTVQSSITIETLNDGDFVWIKQLPNQYRPWFYAMEALLESWWGQGGATVGLVCMLNRPGTFEMKIGDPIAQMICIRKEELEANLIFDNEYLQESYHFQSKREEYQRGDPGRQGPDLDYARGEHFNGVKVPVHIKNWNMNKIFIRNEKGVREYEERRKRKSSM